MNNFIFQIAVQANADITLFNGGIPWLLEKSHQDMAWRDLVDYSITAVPIITSGRTSRKLQRSEYESIAKNLNLCVLMCSLWPGGWQPAVSEYP